MKRSNTADCKSALIEFVGSNPTPRTKYMLTKEYLIDLYQTQSLSIGKIVRITGVSRDSINQYLDTYEITRRTRSETAYLQHGKTFNIKSDLKGDELILYGMGIGLYWGEGNKVDPYSVRLGNTDSDLIITFVNFLKIICGVKDSDIKYGLQLFNDIDEEVAVEFWLKTLNCTRESFHNTIVKIPPQGKGTYKHKSMYGVLQIYVSNKKLKTWLMGEIANYAAIAQG